MFQYWFRLILAEVVTFLGKTGFIGCNKYTALYNNLHTTKAELIRFSTFYNLVKSRGGL
jgi:hypothetical protein